MRQPVDELIQCYQNNLYAVAFNVCKNQMDAEDIVQEAFVQLKLITLMKMEMHRKFREAESLWMLMDRNIL